MIVAAHQPQYLPWIGFIDKIARCDTFVVLDNVQYKDREFQNRNKIRTADGAHWLTVPVCSKGRGRQPICEIQIDNAFPWARKHILSFKAAYGHAPYFARHLPFFEETYKKTWERLSDLNLHIIRYILKEFGIRTPIQSESALEIATTKTERLVAICTKLGADTYLSGAGGRAYLDEGLFPAAGLRLRYQEFHHPVYRQQFMKGPDDFLPHLSVVDLLFNEGPRAREILQHT